jgi:anti-anti-sigma regulatory factor
METRGRMTLDPQPGQIALGGSIDETSILDQLLQHATGGQLVLDLAAVTFINSLGVRDWIRMQAQAQKQGIAIELRRVCEQLVQQLNMILATRAASTVTSFYAPYACDACGREESLVVDAVAHADLLAHGQAPPQACPECGAQMAFNDFPERYFSFLQAS